MQEWRVLFHTRARSAGGSGNKVSRKCSLIHTNWICMRSSMHAIYAEFVSSVRKSTNSAHIFRIRTPSVFEGCSGGWWASGWVPRKGLALSYFDFGSVVESMVVVCLWIRLIVLDFGTIFFFGLWYVFFRVESSFAIFIRKFSNLFF